MMTLILSWCGFTPTKKFNQVKNLFNALRLAHNKLKIEVASLERENAIITEKVIEARAELKKIAEDLAETKKKHAENPLAFLGEMIQGVVVKVGRAHKPKCVHTETKFEIVACENCPGELAVVCKEKTKLNPSIKLILESNSIFSDVFMPDDHSLMLHFIKEKKLEEVLPVLIEKCQSCLINS